MKDETPVHSQLLVRVALLERALRDLLDVVDDAETCAACVPPSEAYEGPHGLDWRRSLRTARTLLEPSC